MPMRGTYVWSIYPYYPYITLVRPLLLYYIKIGISNFHNNIRCVIFKMLYVSILKTSVKNARIITITHILVKDN